MELNTVFSLHKMDSYGVLDQTIVNSLDLLTEKSPLTITWKDLWQYRWMTTLREWLKFTVEITTLSSESKEEPFMDVAQILKASLDFHKVTKTCKFSCLFQLRTLKVSIKSAVGVYLLFCSIRVINRLISVGDLVNRNKRVWCSMTWRRKLQMTKSFSLSVEQTP